MFTEQYVLKEKDMDAINACVTRPNSVWEGIKSIITAEKYTWYLESLAEVKIMPNIEQRKAKWDAMNAAERAEYMKSEDYDEDLKKVLQQVATVLGAVDPKNDDFKLGTKIPSWLKAKTMQRKTAFKAAVAFRFTKDETRELLYTVLEDEKQLDFNPRMVDEMLYAYAILHKISLVSVQKLIESAEIQYLINVFGTKYRACFEQLISHSDADYKVFDAANITETAFRLAAIIEGKQDELARLADSMVEDDSNDESEDDAESGRREKLVPDTSVALLCYDYANDCERYTEPQNKYQYAQRTPEQLRGMFENAQQYLNTALELVELETKRKLYCSMQDFLNKAMEYTASLPSEKRLSPIDYLPLLSETGLGKFPKGDFNEMIKHILLDHFRQETEARQEEQRRVGEYHPYVLPRFFAEHAAYYCFFFSTLMTAVRDLRAVTQRRCPELWQIYIRMNEILFHAFFGEDALGAKEWKYEQHLDAKYDGEETYTLQQLRNMLDSISEKTAEDFLKVLMRSYHIYENYHGNISRAKEDFIGSLEDEKRVIRRMGSKEDDLKDGIVPLFRISNAGEVASNIHSPFHSFYSSAMFNQQYIEKSKPYTRNDIVKLAFWDFVGTLDDYDRFDPELRIDQFYDFFKNIADELCCAPINECNSLDRFLLLCFKYQYPLQFLEAALAYNDSIF